MYFDEADVLKKVYGNPPYQYRTKFHLLGRVLAKMDSRYDFAVFISTNPWLCPLAPSTLKNPISSQLGKMLFHAPFTELPFDTFAEDSSDQLLRASTGAVLFRDVCSVEDIVKFGRPL